MRNARIELWVFLMVDFATDPDVLIWLAAGSYVVGYLIINQAVLRLLLFLGTLFYIGYYATVSEAPLWAAIWTSVLLGVANLIGLGMLMMRRSQWSIRAGDRVLYDHFDHMLPGDFSLIMRHCWRETVTERRMVTREGAPADYLYYLVSGSAQVDKAGHSFALPDTVFIGEVSYLLGSAASATTVVEPGSELLIWDRADIARRTRRNPRFGLALDAAISLDMARKVALAVAPAAPDMARFDRPRAAP